MKSWWISISINSFLVQCDIIGTSCVNGIEAPIIYNLSSPFEGLVVYGVKTMSSKIFYRPKTSLFAVKIFCFEFQWFEQADFVIVQLLANICYMFTSIVPRSSIPFLKVNIYTRRLNITCYIVTLNHLMVQN